MDGGMNVPVVQTMETVVREVLEVMGDELTAAEIADLMDGDVRPDQVQRAVSRLRVKGVGISVEMTVGGPARYRKMGDDGR
jgi:hypothetical protein